MFFLLISCAVPANATTLHFGAAERQLSSATDEVSGGYYNTATLHAVDADIAEGNIKNTVNIFGITGTYESAGGGTNHGLSKTGQQPGLPSGTPFAAGDDASYADPAANDVGYPRGAGSWANYNATRFTTAEPVAGQVVVTDNATGLMWVYNANGAGCFSGGTKTWTQAITSAESLTFAGYSDWRLPNINELISIVDYGRYNPAITPNYFRNTKAAYYWSSTTYTSNSGFAWYIEFYNGYASGVTKANSYYVRPVRGGL